MSKKKPEKLFIEQRKHGWAVEREHAERASFVKATQAKAIARAAKMNPKQSFTFRVWTENGERGIRTIPADLIKNSAQESAEAFST